MAAKASEARTSDTDKAHKATVAAFYKAGFKDVVLFDASKTLAEQPNVTVLIYSKWMSLVARSSRVSMPSRSVARI
jgi:hypothetical protein